MDKIKEFVVAYKWPILAAVFTMLLIGVYQLGIHHQTKAEQERNTDEVKNQALRQRIFGMIEILEKNPKSFCKSQLEIYRDNGTLERLGIEWNPQT